MIISKRNITVDIARIIAAFGVIAIHVSASTKAALEIGNLFSPLCVPFFYLISLTYFVAGLKRESAIIDVFKKIWHRILLPYLAWTLVYIFFMFLKSRLAGLQHSENFLISWKTFFYGCSAVQLYFLPQLMALQAMAFGLYLIWTANTKKKLIGAVLLLLATGYIIIGEVYSVFGTTKMASIFFYLTLAFYFSERTERRHLHFIYILTGVFLIIFAEVSTCIQIKNTDLIYMSHLPLGGLGILLIILGIPKYRSSKLLLPIYSTSFGIYLNHVVFLEGFEFLLKKMHLNFPYDFVHKMLMISIVFICATYLTFAIRQFKITRKIFLGA